MQYKISLISKGVCLFALIVSNKSAGNEQDETMIGTRRQDRRIASTEHSMETVLCSTRAAWAI